MGPRTEKAWPVGSGLRPIRILQPTAHVEPRPGASGVA